MRPHEHPEVISCLWANHASFIILMFPRGISSRENTSDYLPFTETGPDRSFCWWNLYLWTMIEVLAQTFLTVWGKWAVANGKDSFSHFRKAWAVHGKHGIYVTSLAERAILGEDRSVSVTLTSTMKTETPALSEHSRPWRSLVLLAQQIGGTQSHDDQVGFIKIRLLSTLWRLVYSSLNRFVSDLNHSSSFSFTQSTGRSGNFCPCAITLFMTGPGSSAPLIDQFCYWCESTNRSAAVRRGK